MFSTKSQPSIATATMSAGRGCVFSKGPSSIPSMWGRGLLTGGLRGAHDRSSSAHPFSARPLRLRPLLRACDAVEAVRGPRNLPQTLCPLDSVCVLPIDSQSDESDRNDSRSLGARVSTFLEIVGMITVGLVGCVLIGGLALLWFVRKNVRAFFQRVADESFGMQPRRIRLVPVEAPEWEDARSVSDACRELESLGFRAAGFYAAAELSVQLEAWVHAEERLVAVVYEHDSAGVFSDVVAQFEGGGSLTLSSASEGAELDQMPAHIKHFERTATPGELVERLRSEVGSRPRKLVSRDEFSSLFERAYAREIDWRNARGGPSEEELMRFTEQLEGGVDSDKLAELRRRLSLAAAEQLAESCLDQYVSETLLSVAEWEKVRETVSVIHDGLDPEQVIETFTNHAELPEELAQDLAILEPVGTVARDFFAHLNSRLPPPQRYRQIGRVEEPGEADIYALN
jgi:hypothetical protein